MVERNAPRLVSPMMVCQGKSRSYMHMPHPRLENALVLLIAI